MIESEAQAIIRVAASNMGIKLFRNNVGAMIDKRGIPVRYGLANESRKMSSFLKSSDLIGIHSKTGRFVAIECKKPGWTYKGDEREKAQKNFIDLIVSNGGAACFATCPDDLKNLNLG